jgi:hypothetical protein
MDGVGHGPGRLREKVGWQGMLPSRCCIEGTARNQGKYKQPFDQQPRFYFKCIKQEFIASNKTKSGC